MAHWIFVTSENVLICVWKKLLPESPRTTTFTFSIAAIRGYYLYKSWWDRALLFWHLDILFWCVVSTRLKWSWLSGRADWWWFLLVDGTGYGNRLYSFRSRLLKSSNFTSLEFESSRESIQSVQLIFSMPCCHAKWQVKNLKSLFPYFYRFHEALTFAKKDVE